MATSRSAGASLPSARCSTMEPKRRLFLWSQGRSPACNAAPMRLRGAAETRLPMVANLAGHWALGLPLGYYLCFARGMDAAGLWAGLSLLKGAKPELLDYYQSCEADGSRMVSAASLAFTR